MELAALVGSLARQFAVARLKDGRAPQGRVEVALPRFCTAELRGEGGVNHPPHKEGP